MIFFPITWKERIMRPEGEGAADGMALRREREEGKAPLARDKVISAVSVFKEATTQFKLFLYLADIKFLYILTFTGRRP